MGWKQPGVGAMKIHDAEYRVQDERGVFLQLITGEWRQVNVLQIRKGHRRGGHYHKHTRETFYLVAGTVQLDLVDLESGQKDSYRFTTGDCFSIEPFEVHTITALEDALMVAALTRKFSPDFPDLFPWKEG